MNFGIYAKYFYKPCYYLSILIPLPGSLPGSFICCAVFPKVHFKVTVGKKAFSLTFFLFYLRTVNMKVFATVADGSLVIFKQNQGKNTKYKKLQN